MCRKNACGCELEHESKTRQVGPQTSPKAGWDDYGAALDGEVAAEERPAPLFEETRVVRGVARRVNDPKCRITNTNLVLVSNRTPADRVPAVAFWPGYLCEFGAWPSLGNSRTSVGVVRMAVSDEHTRQHRRTESTPQRVQVSRLAGRRVNQRRLTTGD